MLYSPTTAAGVIGCHRDTVRRIASKLGLGQDLPTGLVLTAAEVKRIRKALKPVGNPNFGKRKK